MTAERITFLPRPHRPRGWLTPEEWEEMTSCHQVPTYGFDGQINGVALSLGTFTSGGGGFFGGSRGTMVGPHTRWSLWRDRRWDERHTTEIAAWCQENEAFARYRAHG